MLNTVVHFGGVAFSFEEFIRIADPDKLTFFRKLMPAVVSASVSDEEILTEYNKHYPDPIDIPPFDDVLPFLEFCRECGLHLFAVSGAREKRMTEWFLKHDLRSFFGSNVFCGVIDKAEMLRSVCKNLGIPPRRACYVGDWLKDLTDADEAGLIPIGMTGDRHKGQALSYVGKGATLIVRNFADLRKRIVLTHH